MMDETQHIETLNSRYGIPGVAQVLAGKGGLPMVRVSTHAAKGAIYLYGAHVTSWQPRGAQEVLFVSEGSHWEPGQPIRGGIPICFPWFREKRDDPNAPKHGFVRIKEWRLDSIATQEDGSVTVVCVTESDESTRSLWAHEFCAAYRVTFGPKLRLELSVINSGTESLRFEEALHTYFAVGQAEQARVRGLDKAAYLDHANGDREKVQTGDLVFNGPTDNAYINSHESLELIDPHLNRVLRTEKKNSETTVVWNPGQKGAASLSDFRPDEWQRMVCVEASNVLGGAVLLNADEEHSLRATISILSEHAPNESK